MRTPTAMMVQDFFVSPSTVTNFTFQKPNACQPPLPNSLHSLQHLHVPSLIALQAIGSQVYIFGISSMVPIGMALTLHSCIICLVPPNSKQAQCPPVMLDALVQLGQGLDLSNSFDITVFVIACVAFWSCCR